MRLILSAYLRTLKERGEFDVIMPDLLTAMSIIPLSKPQTGTRQFGVDLSAVGPDPDDNGVRKLFLFVLKQGDIGRSTWDSGPQAVRQSLNDVFDVYLNSHVSPEYQGLPKKIILSTTGDLKEEISANWAGYARDNSFRAEFDFWGADKISSFIEQYMLDEHVFSQEDRANLRRALALVGEPDYSLHDFYKVILRQLGLTETGDCENPEIKPKEMKKALIRANLSVRLLSGWSIQEKNTRHALLAAERTLLWAWHRLRQFPENDKEYLLDAYGAIWRTYEAMSGAYFRQLEAHCRIRDGFSGYTRESAIFSISIFDHIGQISSIGLVHIFILSQAKDEQIRASSENVQTIAKALIGLIANNPAANSPYLDENSIDINLAILFLYLAGRKTDAMAWLGEMTRRIEYTFNVKRHFPIATDSLDDLIELECSNPSMERRAELMSTSWMLPTLAGWSTIFQHQDAYTILYRGQKTIFKKICKQLWHPTLDVFNHLYFGPAKYLCGETEAPINFPEDIREYRQRMFKLLQSSRHAVVGNSVLALDLIACRHFRTPVAPFLLYSLVNITPETDLALAEALSPPTL